MSKLAFIGGTGVYDPEILTDLHEEIIHTPYGDARIESGKFGAKEIIFLARHGVKHTIPPHNINYRANIYALKMLDVAAVVSTTAVGSMNPSYKPGELVLVDQFIDMTKNRIGTFFDGDRYGVAHYDMSHPYCETSVRPYSRPPVRKIYFSIRTEPISVQKARVLKLPLKSKLIACGAPMWWA